jgi:alkanesulfonate monooxygenase SsuD/methylene tetrahydromethanopterin reductase-like flavin-dependent oxidoreductase (luciferase family)
MPLVAGERVEAHGEMISANLALEVPFPRPVPVQVAALGPQMLKLAGARTAGTITWMTGARTIAEHTAPTLRAAAAEAGNPEPFVTAGVPVCVTDDVEEARARAAQVYAVYGQLPSYRAMLDREGLEGPEDLAVIGDEASVRARLEAFAAAGVTDLAASEFGTTADERHRTRALLRDLLR